MSTRAPTNPEFVDPATAIFLSLLQSGLWNRKVEVQTKPDWERLWQMARQQTVAGVLFGAVDFLAEELQPCRELKLKMIAETAAIEDKNRRIEKVLREIAAKYDANGLPYLLLKGSAVAHTYAQPLHRVCGDIDFYLRKEDCSRAQEILFGKTSLPENESRHFENTLHGICIENHFRLTHSDPDLYNDFENELLADAIRLPLLKITAAGYPVNCPSPTFHVLFMLEHMAFHLIDGLGIRHLCDWARFQYFYSDQIDRDAAARIIRKYGFERIATAFTLICTDRLGMNPRYAFFPVERSKQAERDMAYVLQLILKGGNFGRHYDTLHSSKKHLELSKPIRKMVSFCILLRNRRKYRLISPSLWRKTLWKRLSGLRSSRIKFG